MMNHHRHITTPPIKGLVLIGGKSARMGTDKSELNYHGKPQKEFLRDVLVKQGMDTFYSVRNGSDVTSSTVEKSQTSQNIPDTIFNLGPFGGIYSAFQKDPNAAWFVLATDLPFVNETLVKLLLEKRNPAKVATTVKGKGKSFPEPLIAIYEPKAYPIFEQFLSEGNISPKALLINSDVEIIEVEDQLIRNVNTSEEYKAAKKELA